MAGGRVSTLVRTGSMARPPADFLASLPVREDVALPDGQEVTVTTTCDHALIFRPTVTWTFDTREFVIPVTETVSFGWRWVTLVAVALGLVLAGEIGGWRELLTPTSSLAFTLLGVGLLTILHAIAARYQCLERDMMTVASRTPMLTLPAVVAGALLVPALFGTNGFTVITTVTAGGLLVLAIFRPLDSIFPLEHFQDWRRSVRIPLVPAFHSTYTLLATGALLGLLSLVVNPAVPHPRLVILVVALTLLVVIGALWYIPTRKRARVHAFGAAVLSGAVVCFVAIEIMLGSRVQAPALELSALPSLVAISTGVTLTWAGLWWVGIVNPRHVRREFSDKGRQVQTHVAAVFAYLTIMGSGLLGMTAIGTAVVLWRLPTSILTAGFIAVTIALALPFCYFVCGSLYQLLNVCRLTYRIRRHGSTIPEDALPIETAYPVVRLPSSALQVSNPDTAAEMSDSESDDEGDLFAAAYADPFGCSIVLTTHTYQTLSERELAAIIAHEESHFEYRGAQLQFLFATLPALALMGKNVVYSIYDFFQRELTADQHAHVTLSRNGVASPGAPLESAIRRFEFGSVPFAKESSIGFLPTMLSVPEHVVVRRRIERWFELFYGNFAGDVHPDTTMRRKALSVADSIPLTTEADPEARAALIVEAIHDENNEP